MNPKLLVAAIVVMITRDPMTILPATVPKHELPILQTVFGEDNVRDTGEAVDPVEVDADGETTRLENKYGEAALEATHGKAYKSAITQAMQANVVQKPADDGEPDPAADALDAQLDAMTKDELLAEAERRGVKADASMTKAKIISAIESASLV